MDARSSSRLGGVVLLLALTVVVAGCSGGEAGVGDDSPAAASEAEPGRNGFAGSDADAPAEGAESASGGSAGGALNRAPVQSRLAISTGEVELVSEDLVEVRAHIDRLLGRFGGYVAREETHNDDGRTARSTLRLRVPSRHFDEVMASFEEFAEVVDSGREVDDVTTEVIDVASRIRTQEISLERLRVFLRRATQVDDMIRLESEIARREADLASLRAQREYLADQTSLATITVHMSLQGDPASSTEDPLEDAGFLTGLRNGWEALTDVAVVGSTALGALLPFAVVVGVLTVPLVVVLRSVRRRRGAVEPAPPASG